MSVSKSLVLEMNTCIAILILGGIMTSFYGERVLEAVQFQVSGPICRVLYRPCQKETKSALNRRSQFDPYCINRDQLVKPAVVDSSRAFTLEIPRKTFVKLY